MLPTKDFRTQQIQVNKIIASGSTGTNAKLLIYPITSELSSSPNTGVINTSSSLNTPVAGTTTAYFKADCVTGYGPATGASTLNWALISSSIQF